MSGQYFQTIKNSICDRPSEDYDISLLVTGVTGSGKSTLCSFLCCDKNAFASDCGFASVTSTSAAATITLQDKKIKLIDTPGFCDEVETDSEHMESVGEGIFLAHKGVHAVGLVLNGASRFTANEAKAIEEIKKICEIWPFMFLIFTRTGQLGNTEEQRREQLKKNLQDGRCPEALVELVKEVKERYILVESVNTGSDPEAYHRSKIQEFLRMIDFIHEQNSHRLYTNELFVKAKQMLDKVRGEKENLLKKKLLTEKVAKFEEAAKQQKEIAAKEATVKKQIAEAKKEGENRRLAGEEKAMKAKMEETIAKLEAEKRQLEEEEKKLRQDTEKLDVDVGMKIAEHENIVLKEEERRKLEDEAHTEAIENIRQEYKRLQAENKELQEKRNKKWYQVLTKKASGKECIIQ